MMIHVNDTGTLIQFDVGLDLTHATVKEVLFKKPDGTTGSWTASLVGPMILGYITQIGDIDQSGIWTIQPKVSIPDWSGTGDEVNLTVLRNLI
jgi:hypothetical protein